MSAGGLSYSALTTYSKATLPSVEAGLGTLNVLRDPPKSIMTRRKDKVGQTMDITQTIQDSSDRASEAILQFPRGVNPAVGVSYNNYSNNAGTNGHPTNNILSSQQAKLPYRIGVFRPPVLRQENLLPLSRLPRVLFSHTTNPDFPDFSKKMMCPGSEPKRSIIENPLNVSARPTTIYNIETPHKELFENKYIIRNNPLKSSIRSNINMKKDNNREEISVEKFIQTPLNTSVRSNVCVNKENERDVLNTERYIQNNNHYSTSSNASGHTIVNLDELSGIELDRKVPTYTMGTNSVISGKESGDLNINSREYHLNDRLKYGGFSNNGNIPSMIKSTTYNTDYNSNKLNLNKNSNIYMKNRFKTKL